MYYVQKKNKQGLYTFCGFFLTTGNDYCKVPLLKYIIYYGHTFSISSVVSSQLPSEPLTPVHRKFRQPVALFHKKSSPGPAHKAPTGRQRPMTVGSMPIVRLRPCRSLAVGRRRPCLAVRLHSNRPLPPWAELLLRVISSTATTELPLRDSESQNKTTLEINIVLYSVELIPRAGTLLPVI